MRPGEALARAVCRVDVLRPPGCSRHRTQGYTPRRAAPHPACPAPAPPLAPARQPRPPLVPHDAAGVVPEAGARPALAADGRPVPHPRVGGDASADAGGPRTAEVP